MPHDTSPGLSTVCAVCGEHTGAEIVWVIGWPRVEHDRCRDWTRHPFPFTREISVLRRLWREVPAFRVTLEEAGKHLAALERRWPGTHADVLAARTTIATARSALSAAGSETHGL